MTPIMNSQPAESILKTAPGAGTSRRRFLATMAGATVGGGASRMFASADKAATDATAGEILAGTAKVDITPKEGEASIMGKQLEIQEDRLCARVLFLKQKGGTSIAIVSEDLPFFASPTVVAEAKEKWGVDHVLLCATHTHASPLPLGMTGVDWANNAKAPGDIIDWPGLSSDPVYAAMEEKIIAAIGEASKNLFPARVIAGQGPFVSAYMAHNRRKVHPDGLVEMMWDNPKRLPTGPIDPTVGFIRVEDLAGKTRAFLVHYACHPVGTMDSAFVSRDFPGATVDYIEEKLGKDCLALSMQGAAGDLDPYDMRLTGKYQLDVLRQAGISLGKGALRLSESIPSPVKSPGSIKVQKKLLTIPNKVGGISTDVGISTVVINNQVALVAIPGEPFIQHQLDLREKSPLANSFILGYAYGGEGSPHVIYLPTVKAAKEGGYGASNTTFLDPGAGATMVDASVKSIEELIR